MANGYTSGIVNGFTSGMANGYSGIASPPASPPANSGSGAGAIPYPPSYAAAPAPPIVIPNFPEVVPRDIVDKIIADKAADRK
jgi:hypothetical protein